MTIQNLKLKVIPKFPSNVTVGSGLTITNTNGAYSITLAANLSAIGALGTPPARSVLTDGGGSPAFSTGPTVKSATINSNAVTLPAAPAGAIFQVGNVDSTSTVAVYDTFGAASFASGVQFRKARGTAAAPSALQADDPIGSVAAHGYGATGYSATVRGYVALIAGGNWSDTSQPTYVVVATTNTGSTAVTERTRVNPDGTVKWSAYGAGYIKSDASGNLAAGNAIDVVTATSSGTWTKPAGAKRVYVELVAGGGGGGGGARQASGSATSGGGGGGGAMFATGWFDAASLNATEAFTIGAGGNGGGVQATNATAGNAGTAGGNSTFKTLTAFGGGLGAGGQLAANSGGGGGAGAGAGGNASGSTAGPATTLGSSAGGSGAAGQGTLMTGGGGGGGTNGAAGNAGGGSVYGLGGGGAGGGVTAGGAFTAGAAGGTTMGNNGSAGGATDGASGAAISQSISNVGSGGGGGASSVLTAGGTGANGQTPGGGGGGGGSALNTSGNGGAGGAGGSGWIRITTYIN